MKAQTATKLESSLKTRFGYITCDEANTLSFPNGILGMPNQKQFAIAAMPDNKMEKFQVLQSLNDSDVSFAVLPLASLGDAISASDLEEVRKVLEMNGESFLPMLIASVQRNADGVKLSVNLRAPVFIDTATKIGYQIVLTNSKYPIQHAL